MSRAARRRSLAELPGDRAGITALVTGLSLVVILGFIGLAIDVGVGYHAKRQAQNAADSAAYSAAIAEADGASSGTTEAQAITAAYGLQNGSGGVTVTVNQPPKSGNYTSNHGAVEVIVTRPGVQFFSELFNVSAATVAARAVALQGGAGTTCVLALNSKASASDDESNGAQVTLNGCGVFSNSTSASAIEVTGGAVLNALSVGTSGGALTNNGGTIKSTDGIATDQAALADPYASTPVPSFTGCNQNGYTLNSGSYTIGPTGSQTYVVYCNGLTFQNGANVTMDPGIYIIDRGEFSVQGGATVTGTGVSIVLTSSTGSGYGTINIANGTTVRLSAPTSGPMAGLVIYQDRNAPATTAANACGSNNNSNVNYFAGGTNDTLSGALYFPAETLCFNNGSGVSSGCTEVIANEIDFTGGANLGLSCSGLGVKIPGGQSTMLVE